MAWPEIVAELDKLLTEAKLSNAEIARAMNVSPSQVSRWRSGERVPDPFQFGEMVRLAKGSADELLGLVTTRVEQQIENARREREKLDRLLADVEARRRG